METQNPKGKKNVSRGSKFKKDKDQNIVMAMMYLRNSKQFRKVTAKDTKEGAVGTLSLSGKKRDDN